MLEKLIKFNRDAVAQIRLWLTPHKLAHGALACLYLAAFLGLEKTIVCGLLAIVYAALALVVD
jgi:hypothetical protein